MNSIPSPNSDLHQRVKLLLPWYVKQSLDPEEHRMVEKHVGRCLKCRHALTGLRKLNHAVNLATDMDVAADISFASLQNKMQKNQDQRASAPSLAFIDRIKPKRHALSFLREGLKSDWQRASMGFAVAALFLLALLPIAWKQHIASNADHFYTLSAGKPQFVSKSQLRVVFSQDSNQAKIDAILAKIVAQQVEGPNSMGAFTVTIDTATQGIDLITAVSYLREQSEVVFAEPVLQP